MMDEQNVEFVVSCNIFLNADLTISIIDNKEIAKLGWPHWVRKSYVKKISELPILSYVHERLVRGDPEIEVSRMIKEQGYHTDCEIHRIRNFVNHYKATIPRIIMLAKQNPEHAAEVAKKVRKDVDTLGLMSWAIELQKERIEQYRKIENTSPIPIPETRKEIETFVNMITKYDDVKTKAGFSDRNEEILSNPSVQRFDLDRVYSREGVNRVMDDPRSRFKVVQAVERIFDLVSKKKEIDITPVEVSPVLEDMVEQIDLSGIKTKFEAEASEGMEDGDDE